jgi:hypothetical protein
MGVVLAGREIVKAGRAQGRDDGVIYDRLVNLYGLQPTLGVRTSTSVREQAYSTPVPLAFLASRRAMVMPDSLVGEPTAGNTMLLIEVDPERATVNEINADRAANARALGFEVTSHDAARRQLAPEKTLDRVIANPPFGAVKGEDGQTVIFPVAPNYGTREIDHAIAFKSLDAMKDDGSAVLILGGVDASSEEMIRDGYRGTSKREFYFRLYSQYGVVDHFTVDGGLYSKQGAGYPVDVVVIRGRGKATRAMPAADLPTRYDNWQALKKDKLDGSTQATPADGVVPTGTGTGTGSGGGQQDGQTGRVPVVGGSGRAGAGNGGQGARPGSGGNVGGQNAGQTGTAGRPGRGGGAGTASPGATDGTEPGRDGIVPGQGDRGVGTGAPGANGNRPGAVGGSGSGQTQRVESGLTDRRGQEEETATQVEYAPASGAASVGTLVPRAMRDSIQASLKRVADKVGNIDEYVAEKLNYDPDTLRTNFSAEQIDALALAIVNAEEGTGFIIGDQTGIGKGRVVAGMIRYAMVNGKTPVFITEKPNLYADMIRDLDDIGMGDELQLQSNKPLILATNSGEPVPYVIQRKVGDEIVETEHALKAPGSGVDLAKKFDDIAASRDIGPYKVVFTTYSQMQTVAGKVTARMRMVDALSDGGYMIFDESHNAGGTQITQARTKADRDAVAAGSTTGTGRSGFVRGLVRKSDGSFFSSATYAKRPDVLDLYSSTNMMLAVDKPSDLAPAIIAGGVPMQQIVATMLAKDGQYIRRERTFAGVTYETRPMTVDRQTAENMAQSMRMILEFSRLKEGAVKSMQKELDREGSMIRADGGEKTTVQGANFGAIMHNLIDQMLLSLKASESVDFAIERLKAGEKVVLTVSNTMGSFLADYADEFGIRPGEPVSLSFADLYQRYLEKQRMVTIKRPGGQKEQIRLTDEDLGGALVTVFNDTARFIREAGFGAAPISPIDYMHEKLRKAGYKTDEITGRTITVNYAGAAPTLGTRNSKIKERLKAIRGFNGGTLDVLILNQSGATGISLHASSKFKDQRKRRMIIVQAEKNIDQHVQMLGRVQRTGQVITPDYTQAMADIPAEARPAAVLAKKMASLNANTTASRKSAVTAEGVVDFMNDYGGQVAAEFLMDNPDVHRSLGGQRVIALPDDLEKADEELIRKLTGYIPILPLAQQEAVYSDLVERYNDLLARENAMGTNKLEAAALDLGAKTIKSEQITPQRQSAVASIFADPAFMEQVDVAHTVKPLTKTEVQDLVTQALGGKTADQVSQAMRTDLAARVTEFSDQLKKQRESEGADLDTEKKARMLQELDGISMRKTVLSEMLARYKIGQEVTIAENRDGDQQGALTYGVITSITSTGKTKNPAAASGYKFTLALANGEGRSITISASQIDKQFLIRAEPGPVMTLSPASGEFESMRVLDMFDAYNASGGTARREKRWMVTGNLLAGFASYPGRIITYTKDDGTTSQGVLMRRGFDFEKQRGKAKATFQTADLVRKFMDEAGVGATVGTPDGNLSIKWMGGAVDFSVTASKREGGRYFLDKGLTDQLGRDFTRMGQRYRVRVGEGELMRALQYLMTERNDVTLEALTNKDVARKVLGLPDVTDSQLSRVVREEGAVYRVNEQGDDSRDIPGDMFPDTFEALQPTESDPRINRKRRNPGGVAVSKEVPTAVLAVRQDPAMPGLYHHTSQLVQVGVRDLPVAEVTNWQEAASALSSLGSFAVEHFDALITDKDGKPLAVVGAFKGALAQAAVYPSTVLAEALRIEGAASAWAVHNHPSGDSSLSKADRRLSDTLLQVFDPSSIKWMGVAAVGNGTYSAYDRGVTESGVLIEGKTVARVPLVERTIQRLRVGMPVISSPAEALKVLARWSNNKPGILFVSSHQEVTAWVPVNPKTMGELRAKGRFDKLINSASQAGARAAMISNPGNVMPMTVLDNIASALDLSDVEVLDVIDPTTGKSIGGGGMLQSNKPVFSRGGTSGKGMTVAQVRRIAEDLASKWESPPPLVVVQSLQDDKVPADVRAEDEIQRKRGATGTPDAFLHQGVVYLVADAIKNEAQAAENFMHEALGHYGLRAAFGKALDGILDTIALARPDLMRKRAAEYGQPLTLPDAKAIVQQRRQAQGIRLNGPGLESESLRLLRMSRRVVAEEVLAVMAQTEPTIGFVRRAVAAIRTWLRANVPALREMKLTDDEIIRSYLMPARNVVQRGQGQADPAGLKPAFSRRQQIAFYSALARGLEGVGAKAAPAAGWKDAIKGLVNKGTVKADEVEWSGVNDWLDLQQGKVTKEQVAQYLEQGGVKVEETVLVNEPIEGNGWQSVEGGTKYSAYTLPGGTNNREVLLRLPLSTISPAERAELDRINAIDRRLTEEEASRRAAIEQKMTDLKQAKYMTSHWDESNVLAHIRVNDRTDADGKRVLFVEEIQSDWGQQGKKHGFKPTAKARAEMDLRIANLTERIKAIRDSGVRYPAEGTPEKDIDPRFITLSVLIDERARLQSEQRTEGSLAPLAPFVTKTDGWLNLALKRVVMMAVDEGYDRVAFVTGQQAADRFNVGGVMDYINYRKNDDGTLDVFVQPIRGEQIAFQDAQPDEVERHLGKEVVGMLMREEGDLDPALDDLRFLNVRGKAIGGQGMKTFYDTIVPNAVNALLKKLGGGKVGAVTLAGVPSVSVQKKDVKVLAMRLMRGEIDRGEFIGMAEIEDLTTENEVENILFFDAVNDTARARNAADGFVDLIKKRAAGAKPMSQPGFDVSLGLRQKTAGGLPMFSRVAQAIRNQIDTVPFKNWFGDSKVVGADGKPLVVYHGTIVRGTKSGEQMGDIKVFDRMFSAKFRAPSIDTVGSWFSTNPGEGGAQMYSGTAEGSAIYPVYLSIKNPQVTTFQLLQRRARLLQNGKDDGRRLGQAEVDAYRKWLKEMGKDGIKIEGSGNDNSTEFDNQVAWIVLEPTQVKSATGNNGDFNPGNPDVRFSRGPAPALTAAQRAEEILNTPVMKARPLDRVFSAATRMTGLQAATTALYNRSANLLDRLVPEKAKAGIISDYGVPEAVIDMRVRLQGRQRQQLRQAGELVDKLANLTRAESRVAYEWMNMDGSDPRAYISMTQGLPEESVKVLLDVQRMIDDLSKEAVRMGQLDPRSYERNKFAYLRRTYDRYVDELTPQQKSAHQKATRILGDQYRMRGLVEPVEMAKIKMGDPEWWGIKERQGKGDADLINQKFIRLERLKHSGAGTAALPGMTGRPDGKVLEVAYLPAERPIPAKYADWRRNEVFEVRDVKGGKVVLWRDFTKEERESMGEIDEARFAIARTLQRMVHDVEVGRYLEKLSQQFAKADGDEITGTLVEASEAWHRAFTQDEWVRVPETKITGTSVAKYGKLAGKYLPGPIWNDVRFSVNGASRPLGEVYSKILSAWKVSKTALSPAVHTNNVMANLVMADWHDVGAAHVTKALRVILAANQKNGKGALGSLGNVLANGGIADRDAALAVMNRYRDAGGDIGSWATQEIAREQMAPLLDAVLAELGRDGDASIQGQIGVMAALQHMLHLKLPQAWTAFKASKPATLAGREVASMIDLYQAEDDVFRLAAWLAAKERGVDDLQAGREARKSFLDYDINAPWVDAMRRSAWPFIAFTYRAVPMLIETAAKRPHKILKLATMLGALNMLGVAMSGDDDGEDERRRRMLPEEKAGKVWGVVPKLIRMPWNDKHGSPVYLDIRRFIPVGDIVDTGSNQAALPVPPGLMPGGPLVILAEVLMNKSSFTGKPIVLETDTGVESASKVLGHLYKALAPNLLGLPGTYATDSVVNAGNGKTDAFGREQSMAQALASSIGVKLGSYPEDVMRRNVTGKASAERTEITRVMRDLQRQRQRNAISESEFDSKMEVQRGKLQKLSEETREKMAQ